MHLAHHVGSDSQCTHSRVFRQSDGLVPWPVWMAVQGKHYRCVRATWTRQMLRQRCARFQLHARNVRSINRSAHTDIIAEVRTRDWLP